jgi:hypothetical protein
LLLQLTLKAGSTLSANEVASFNAVGILYVEFTENARSDLPSSLKTTFDRLKNIKKIPLRY